MIQHQWAPVPDDRLRSQRVARGGQPLERQTTDWRHPICETTRCGATNTAVRPSRSMVWSNSAQLSCSPPAALKISRSSRRSRSSSTPGSGSSGPTNEARPSTDDPLPASTNHHSDRWVHSEVDQLAGARWPRRRQRTRGRVDGCRTTPAFTTEVCGVRSARRVTTTEQTVIERHHVGEVGEVHHQSSAALRGGAASPPTPSATTEPRYMSSSVVPGPSRLGPTRRSRCDTPSPLDLSERRNAVQSTPSSGVTQPAPGSAPPVRSGCLVRRGGVDLRRATPGIRGDLMGSTGLGAPACGTSARAVRRLDAERVELTHTARRDPDRRQDAGEAL